MRLSVILIAHDRQEFIDRAIESVRSQAGLSEPPEVILVTNLPDAWWEGLPSEFAYKSIRMGGSASDKFLRGYEASTGEVICFLEDDDEYAPGRLAKIESLFRADLSIDFYHNTQMFIDVDSERVSGENGRGPCKVLETDAMDSREIYHLVKENAAFNVGSIAVRRTLLDSAMRTFGREWFGWDTYLFYAGVTLGRRLVLDPAMGTRVRLHAGNLSAPTSAGRSPRAFFERRRAAATTLLNCYRALARAISTAHPNHPALLAIDLQEHYAATFVELDGMDRRRRDIGPMVSWLFQPSYLLRRAYFWDIAGVTLYWELAAVLSLLSPRLMLEGHALLVKVRWGL